MLISKFKNRLLSAALMAVLFSSCNETPPTIGVDDVPESDSVNKVIANRMRSISNIQGPAGNLYVDDGGSGGIPVVFIHSFGGSTVHWNDQLQTLRSNRRAIAIDLRGHGRSAAPANNDYELSSLANDIAVVVDSLKLDSFILVGHSMGGSAAIAYAGGYPQRVKGLVIVGTPGKSSPEQANTVIASLESDKYESVMENYMKQLLAGAKPATERLEREGMNKIPKDASISIIKAVFAYDPLPDLRNYPGPKLIISKVGEDQPNSLHKAFPAIPYKTMEGTSHWMQLDDPVEFNRILLDFLANIN